MVLKKYEDFYKLKGDIDYLNNPYSQDSLKMDRTSTNLRDELYY